MGLYSARNQIPITADFSNVQADHYLLSSTDTLKILCLADAECIALYISIFYNALA